jgi:hypothetical protein
MQYWILKGNPRENDWDSMLKPGRRRLWHTRKRPLHWAKSDRMFCWESSPKLRVIGLADLIEPDSGSENGNYFFRVRYLTHRLTYMPTIKELRQTPVLGDASFLKAGPAATAFAISQEQAEILFRLLLSKNPELQQMDIWPDIQGIPYSELVPDLLAFDIDNAAAVREGGLKFVSHLLRERNRAILETKKKQVLQETGRLSCEVCGFDFVVAYGARGEGFCEIHHISPLSSSEKEVETRLEDLAILCANCHRMIHRRIPWLDLNQLKSSISAEE